MTRERRSDTCIRVYVACAIPLVAILVVGWGFGPVAFAPKLVLGLSFRLVPPTLVALVARGIARSGWVSTPSLRRLVDYIADAAIVMGALWALPVMMVLGTAVVTPFGGPLRDEELALLERSVGLTQLDLYQRFAALGALPTLDAIYQSVNWQFKIAFGWFVLVRGDLYRCWEINAVLALAALIGLPGYLLFPAEGPWVHLGHVGSPQPTFLADFRAMRTGMPVLIARPDGYVAFPSYHTVFAVVLTWCYRGEVLFWPALALNAAVLVATWVVGWHYLSDMVGGAVLIALCIRILDRLREGRLRQAGS